MTTVRRSISLAALFLAGAASAAPDLTFSSVSTRHVPYRRGAPLIIEFTMNNVGNMISSNPIVRIMLSPDSTITLADLELGQKLYAAIPAGGSLHQFIAGNLPTNIAPGQHFIGLYTNSIGETNFANNGVADPLPIEVYCPGDTDGDQDVDFADLNTVLAQFGQVMGLYAGDVNGDTRVDFADLNIVLAVFGGSGC